MGNIVLCLVLSVLLAQFIHNGRAHVLPSTSNHSQEAFLKATKFLTQKLDHFDPENSQTWQQMYYIQDKRSDKTKKNVVFLMISGDSPAWPTWMSDSAWATYAEEFNAFFIQFEHRFYGRSRPTGDLSVESLKYLTSEQALEDLAVFIKTMNEENNFDQDVKWIAFGGFYAGSLAAWLREKHPELVHAAISTGAPLKAVPDFQDYYKVVADNLRNINGECHDAVGAALAQVKDLLKDKEGQRNITSLFKLCDPLEKHADDKLSVARLFATLAENFATITQNNDNGLGGINLQRVCAIMTDSAEPQEIKRLARFNKELMDYYYTTCTEYRYDDMIDAFKGDTYAGRSANGPRQWLYQKCNEFGYHQTSNAKPQIFGDQFGLDYFVQQCADVFGSKFTSSYVDSVTKRTNSNYGGLKPNVTNVLFVHGSVDPWHALGLTSSLSLQAPALYIEGASHCSDMYSESSSDSPALKAARGQIRQQIQSWLNK